MNWATVQSADEFLLGEISGQEWVDSIKVVERQGMISVAINSTNLVGDGTNFTIDAQKGDLIYTGLELLEFGSINSPTEAILVLSAKREIDEEPFSLVDPVSRDSAKRFLALKILCLEQAKRYLQRIPGLIIPHPFTEKETLLQQAQILWANMLFNGSYQDQGFKTQTNITSKKMGDASYDYDLAYKVSNIPSVVNDLISGLIAEDSYFSFD